MRKSILSKQKVTNQIIMGIGILLIARSRLAKRVKGDPERHISR